MTGPDTWSDPMPQDLRAIEAEDDLLLAELALLDAEQLWHSHSSSKTAAYLIQALLDLIDTHSPIVHQPAPRSESGHTT